MATLSRLTAAALTLALAACGESGGLSTADVREAAQERVRAELGLTEDAATFTNLFVGEPVDGDTVVCGTVEGRRADGTVITPRRFIAAADPARWIKFEPATGLDLPSQPDKFIEWHTTCAGEEAVR